MPSFLKKNSAINVHPNHLYFTVVDMLTRLTMMLLCRPPHDLQVFHTGNSLMTKHLAQMPHFDYRPCLKAMIYLDDCCSLDTGGLFLIPKSFLWVRSRTAEKRLAYHSPGKTDAAKYFEMSPYQMSDFIYKGGHAGDVLFFLTDNFHFQGHNKNQAFNRISRIHAYHP